MASNHGARIAALQKLLHDSEFEALFVSDLVNIRYLCGFVGTYGMLLVGREDATFITDGRYAEAAERVVTNAEVRIRPLVDADKFFQSIFREKGYKSVGFEGSIVYSEYETLKKHVKPSKAKLAAAPALVQQLRRVKDKSEIAAIAKAAKVADGMMGAAWEAAKPGITELELAKIVRRACEDLGGEELSFSTIIAGGENSSRPHHHPEMRRLKNGEPLTIDLGAKVNGYCSDMTRNPVIGKVHPKFREIYEVCLEAQVAALKAVKAGVATKEIDAIARDIISSKGYGNFFNHGTGHGVGLDIHEAPRLTKTSDEVLEVGNVVTVEPGIYLPGFGGVRIEDLVVVTEGAPRVLSRTPKVLTVLGAQ